MDKGTIQSADGSIKFTVTDLKAQEDSIHHVGKFDSEQKFEAGQEVNLSIDPEFRKINARIHSAGHLLDMAMNRAGRVDLKPGKGYHFQEGPYVEYIGVVPEGERDALLEQLNKHANDIIAEAKEAGT